jgi:hypothetical protein
VNTAIAVFPAVAASMTNVAIPVDSGQVRTDVAQNLGECSNIAILQVIADRLRQYAEKRS